MTRLEAIFGVLFAVAMVLAAMCATEFNVDACRRFLDIQRSMAGVTFTAIGIWLALLLPKELVERLARAEIPPAMKDMESKAIETLTRPLVIAAIILIATTVMDYAIPIGKDLVHHGRIDRDLWQRIGLMTITATGLLQVYSFVYVVYPIARIKDGQAKRIATDQIAANMVGNFPVDDTPVHEVPPPDEPA